VKMAEKRFSKSYFYLGMMEMAKDSA
jgi:hypothetical protein